MLIFKNEYLIKYLTDFDSVKSFKINIFSGIFELHRYSRCLARSLLFAKKLNLFHYVCIFCMVLDECVHFLNNTVIYCLKWSYIRQNKWTVLYRLYKTHINIENPLFIEHIVEVDKNHGPDIETLPKPWGIPHTYFSS